MVREKIYPRFTVRLIAYFWLAAIVLASCSSPQPAVEATNPASENCIKQGGELSIQKRGNGWEYGICIFDNNRQCEEWAMMRGECPVGGVQVAGYNTPASQYCAITGGEYSIMSNSGAVNEQGTCSFECEKSCDVWLYFNGKCGKCVGK